MRTLNVTSKTITLGRQMENEATEIIFDLSDLISTFGNGTATLVHQRKQDTAPYIVSSVVQDGSTLTWTVTDTDTAFRGPGELELRWVVGETLAKSIIYQTKVLASITADITIPEALQSWYDSMIAYINSSLESAVDGILEEAQESGDFDGVGIASTVLNADYTLTLTFTDGSTYTTPSIRGAQGENAGYAIFDVDDATGQMVATVTDALDSDVAFVVNEDIGALEVTINE